MMSRKCTHTIAIPNRKSNLCQDLQETTDNKNLKLNHTVERKLKCFRIN